MKVLEKNPRENSITIQLETTDDLWVLFNIVKEGDIVYARTTREVKVGEGSEGRRIPMVLGIKVKGVEFQQFTDKIRIKGVVVEGPEEYGVKGKHHTLTLGTGDTVKIVKEQWSDFELHYINKFTFKRLRVMIVSVDPEEACIGILTEQGVKYVWEYTYNLPSKAYTADHESLLREYIREVVNAITSIASREEVNALIIAGPGEMKNVVKRIVLEKLNAAMYSDATASGGCQGVREVLGRDVVKNVLRDLAIVKAKTLLEEFKELLVKEPSLVAYGVQDVYEATLFGAVSKLVVVDELLKTSDEEERRKIYDALDNAVKRNADIIIVSAKSDVGVEVSGFGGVISILRFKLQKV
ncbi:MAG: mRNA surveillance protein pelota [Desulfurococcaceae archaeon]